MTSRHASRHQWLDLKVGARGRHPWHWRSHKGEVHPFGYPAPGYPWPVAAEILAESLDQAPPRTIVEHSRPEV